MASNEEKTLEELARIVFEKAAENGNCLCVVNLKSQAREIYKAVKALDMGGAYKIVHLSTAMYGAHKREKLLELKELLAHRKKVICVSTQLIEAGVDLSFSCVVRAMAGLDSILQAAGRCNRNGECGEIKRVYAYPIQDERGLDKLREIKIGKEITQRIIHENPGADLLSEDILQKFYYYYFYDRKGEMDYMTKTGATVYDMLSVNDKGQGNYKNRTGRQYHQAHGLAQAFATAGKHFAVIPDLTKTVVVRDGMAEELLARFKPAGIDEKIRLLRQLQDYTVALFDYDYKKLADSLAISLYDEEFGIYVLDKSFYSDEYGVKADAEMPTHVI